MEILQLLGARVVSPIPLVWFNALLPAPCCHRRDPFCCSVWPNQGMASRAKRVSRAEVDGTAYVQGDWWGKGRCSDCILKWVGNNTGCENIIKNLQNQHSFFLVNMKARQLHLPHMCLANCCSGRRASLSGVWELIEARIGIPALCWVEQGVSMILKAVLVQVVVELKLEYIYIYTHPSGVMWILWYGSMSLVRFCRNETWCRQKNWSDLVKGDLWVISFLSKSSPS